MENQHTKSSTSNNPSQPINHDVDSKAVLKIQNKGNLKKLKSWNLNCFLANLCYLSLLITIVSFDNHTIPLHTILIYCAIALISFLTIVASPSLFYNYLISSKLSQVTKSTTVFVFINILITFFFSFFLFFGLFAFIAVIALIIAKNKAQNQLQNYGISQLQDAVTPEELKQIQTLNTRTQTFNHTKTFLATATISFQPPSAT